MKKVEDILLAIVIIAALGGTAIIVVGLMLFSIIAIWSEVFKMVGIM